MKNLVKTGDKKQPDQAKQPYRKPELKSHGSVEQITLQGFFGSFSP